MSESVLSIIKNCSSRNPMPLSSLAHEAGVAPETLESTVGDLYQDGRINKCSITRDGITEVVIWPVGAIPKENFKSFTIQMPKPEKLKPKISQQEEKMEKSKTQIILEMIAEKGSVALKELEIAAGTTAVKAFVKSHVDRGLIAITGGIGSKVYSLASGVSGEQLLANVRGKAPSVVAEQHEEPVVKEVITQIQFSGTEKEKRRFRVARTSDETLMLFGLNDSVIELNEEETATLVKFVGNSFVLSGAADK